MTLLYLLLTLNSDAPQQGIRLAASDVVLWVSEDGRVWASGDDEPTRGDSALGARRHFQVLSSLENIVSVDIVFDGSDNAAALDRKGQVWLWGTDWGPLLHGSDKEHEPALVSGLENITAIALGDSHLVALDRGGKVYTLSAGPWGNEYGQLGTGDREGRKSIWTVPGIEDAVAVAAEGDVTLILRRDGSVWGMGNGCFLGREGSLLEYSFPQEKDPAVTRPVAIAGLRNIRQVAVGQSSCLALDNRGQVWGWGVNDHGQLGLPADDLTLLTPQKLAGLDSIRSIDAGFDFTLALTRDGRVLAQGCNVYGALGDKRNELDGPLREIPGLRGVKQIYAGHYNAFARLSDGSFVGWGANDAELGGFHPQADTSSIPPTTLDAQLRSRPTSQLVLDGGVAVRLQAALDEVDWKGAQLEVLLGDEPVGRLELSRSVVSAELTFEIPAGTHRYSVRGEIEDESGEVHRVRRGGALLVVPGKFTDSLESNLAASGPQVALAQLRERVGLVSRGLAGRIDPLQSQGPLSAAEIEAFETERPLPEPYRQALTSLGPFRFGPTETLYPRIALYSPAEMFSLAQYVDQGLSRLGEEPQDEFDAEMVGTFEDLAEVLNAPELKTARRSWGKNLVGASIGEELYIMVGQHESDPSQPYPQVITDLGYEEITDEGSSVRFDWPAWSQSEQPIQEYLIESLAYEIAAQCAELGIVAVGRTEPAKEVQVFLEIAPTDEGKPLVKLSTEL